MSQPKLVRPAPTNISRDSYSWEDAQKHWQEAKLERRRQIQLRLAAIPTAKTNRSTFMELPLEIRERILEYSIEWKDLLCVEHRGRSGRSKWQKLFLSELPFWFVECPPVLALNRQILGEAIGVLMRRPLVIAPLQRGQRPQKDGWANPSIVWPMARLFKLFEMASWGQKVHSTPRLLIEAPDVLGEKLWAPLREVLLIWKEGMVYEHLNIQIKQSPEVLSIYSAGGVQTVEVVGKDYPEKLVVRSSQWASLSEMSTVEKKFANIVPWTLKSLEYSLQAPISIAMNRCMAGKTLKVHMLTGIGG